MRAVSATALLCKTFEGIVTGSPLTIYVSHSVGTLLNSHHMQHYSVSHLASYEVLLLTASNLTPARCNTLLTLLLYFTQNNAIMNVTASP